MTSNCWFILCYNYRWNSSTGIGFLFVIATMLIIVLFSRHLRQGGSTMIVLGAIYELLSQEKRQAIHVVLDAEAGKKSQEDSPSEPSNQDMS